jgi:carboxypeptidase Q
MQVDPALSNQNLQRSSGKGNRKWAFVLVAFTICVVIAIIVVLAVVLTKTNEQPMAKIQAEYQEKANIIIKYSISGEGSGKAYDWVANISDLFGHRKIGSKALEDAIDHNVDQFKNEYRLENVHTENVNLPQWTRGQEIAYLISPRIKRLAILGLGTTVGTDGKNLTAEVIVVTSWDDLAARCNLTGSEGVKDKIVVFNPPWVGSYGAATQYRGYGASRASRCGAKAALIRSASSFSINSPHTGIQRYDEGIDKIPAISLAPEDADLMNRMQDRGVKMEITLNTTSQNHQESIISRNTIFDLPGSILPNEIIMISGHFDSWDVGSGAMDNGAGASIALRALVNLKSLIDQNRLPRPKRTIRGILWTAEEPGMLGSQKYYRDHKNDTDIKYVFLQEADEGFFPPLALMFSGSPAAKTMFQNQIYPLIKSLNASLDIGSMGDSDWWAQDGVPGMMMASTGDGYLRYFAFHHSEGDTPSVYNRHDLDGPTAIWAVVAYVLADMNETLPIGPRVEQ